MLKAEQVCFLWNIFPDRLHSSGISVFQDHPKHHYINPEWDSVHSLSVATDVIL